MADGSNVEVLESRRFAWIWTRVEGNWKQMKGTVKERWGKLTDDDLTAIAGRRDQLEGMIQERYGYAKERARREIETGSTRSSRTLQNRLNRSAAEFKNCLLPSSALLKSSSLMPAQEQQMLSLMPRKRSSETRSLLSPSHWVWDF